MESRAADKSSVTSGASQEDLPHLLARLSGVTLFREVLEDPAVRLMARLLETLSDERSDGRAAAEAFARLWGELATQEDPLLADGWRSRLVAALLDTETAFARAAERGRATQSVREQAARDLATLGRLFALDARRLAREVVARDGRLEGVWGGTWPELEIRPEVGADERRALARQLEASGDWSAEVGALAEFFSRNGAGVFARYRTFRWEAGSLRPVPEPDETTLDDLFGYEREREKVLRNTERFARGLPAHHALLYGPPGTGKSSTVKAAFNRYSGEGVRLVEVAKERLPELPRLLDELRGRGPRFIVFVDDLSFEEDEVEYKTLKALIEGSVESPPPNVRVYATSNRRNLVRETFSERDDVHARDTMGEKLSLAARFGLRVTFPVPDGKTYLRIVRGIARERGLRLTEAETRTLEEYALDRERWGSGRSGRAARQAVDDFEADNRYAAGGSSDR